MKIGRTTRIVLSNVTIVVLIFSLFEIYLRSTHFLGAGISWSYPDPKIGWRLRPNHNYWINSNENDHPIEGRTNNFSWNDKNWSLEKKPGTYRIAILGDSYVEALQVERSHHFVTLAQSELNDEEAPPGIQYELMNFGRSGFTQTEELWVLENEVFKFDPDLVILFFYPPNDIMDVHQDTAGEPLRPFPIFEQDGSLRLDTSFNQSSAYKIKSFLAPIKNNSALISTIVKKIRVYRATRSLKQIDPDQRRITSYLSLATMTPDEEYARNYRINKKLIEAMRDICADKEVEFLLVSIDTPDYRNEVADLLREIDQSFRRDFYALDLAEFSLGSGMSYLDLQSVFRAHYEEKGTDLHFSPRGGWLAGPIPMGFGHEGHWNYTGHQVVAGALVSKIQYGMMEEQLGPP